MPLITHSFLNDLGIQMDTTTFASFQDHMLATLQERIINEIVDELSPEQAQELAGMVGVDDEVLQQWLIANVPDLDQIVADEVDIIRGEIAENSDKLVG